MATLTGLVWSILPLVLVASVSPVIFLNASTATSNGGQRSGWYFVLGNAVVLLALGIAGVGVLGSTASTFAEREIASIAVDRLLGVALLGYAAWLIWTKWRTRRPTDADPASIPSPVVRTPRDLVSWGALGMITNFTSLPLFISVSQRIGAANISWLTRVPLLLAVIALVLTPAWLPVSISRFSPQKATVSEATRHRIAHWTSLASIAACLVGGVALLWLAR